MASKSNIRNGDPGSCHRKGSYESIFLFLFLFFFEDSNEEIWVRKRRKREEGTCKNPVKLCRMVLMETVEYIWVNIPCMLIAPASISPSSF